MPSNIVCYVGRYRVPAGNGAPKLEFGSKSIEAHFREASVRAESGQPDIGLSIDTSRWAVDLNPTGNGPKASPYDLNTALHQLLRPQDQPAVRDAVGLILSTSYVSDDQAYGMMFTQFEAKLKSFYSLPRTGAAVFLDRIAETRDSTGPDYLEQLGFTAIHELGHVFNLWHMEPSATVPVNFMSSSDPARNRPTNTTFNDTQRQWLRQCSDQANIHPGGSDFGVYGQLNGGPTSGNLDRPFKDSLLRLQISAPQPECHYFEPLELDITVGLAPGQTRTRTIPHEIDPGYSSFTVWITEPDGERRRYRPTEQYCPSHRRLPLESRRPFKRDMTLFGSAQGYTFRKVGVHRIEAVFTPRRGSAIRSNVVEIMIKPPKPDSGEYCDLKNTLTQQGVAALLYYRQTQLGSSAVDELTALCERHSRTDAAAGGHYALGRAFAKHAVAAGTAEARRFHARIAVQHLHAALRSRRLKGRRAARAEELLEQGLGS